MSTRNHARDLADEVTPNAQQLWRLFIDELGRYGVITKLGDGMTVVRTSSGTIEVSGTAHDLRTYILNGLAGEIEANKDGWVGAQGLPIPLIDEMWEEIESDGPLFEIHPVQGFRAVRR